MLIETSAIVAMVLGERNAQDLVSAVRKDIEPRTSVVNAFEAVLAVGRVIEDYRRASTLVTTVLDTLGVRVVGIDAELYDALVDAYARYGKGTGHPARLNFGDCFSYALARTLGDDLLFQGKDFTNTDIRAAI